MAYYAELYWGNLERTHDYRIVKHTQSLPFLQMIDVASLRFSTTALSVNLLLPICSYMFVSMFAYVCEHVDQTKWALISEKVSIVTRAKRMMKIREQHLTKLTLSISFNNKIIKKSYCCLFRVGWFIRPIIAFKFFSFRRIFQNTFTNTLTTKTHYKNIN